MPTKEQSQPPERSNRQILQAYYNVIMEVATPGDVLFFISDSGKQRKTTPGTITYREWQGFHPTDTSNWHTAVYVGPKKESKGANFRPQIVHAHTGGTDETRVPPEFFKSKDLIGDTVQNCRIEIVHIPQLTSERRKIITDYARLQIGKPFDGDGWKKDIVTYALGVRSQPRNPDVVSCHGLAYEAYERAGLRFPHQLKSAPAIYANIFGYPLGHPIDHVDLRYNYLRDHHLYRDPRFKSVLAVIGDGSDIASVKTEINPGKYSWNPALQAAYGLLAYS